MRAATDREMAEQSRLERTDDFAEGVAAYAERPQTELHRHLRQNRPARTGDSAEGVAAYADRRKPNFTAT